VPNFLFCLIDAGSRHEFREGRAGTTQLELLLFEAGQVVLSVGGSSNASCSQWLFVHPSNLWAGSIPVPTGVRTCRAWLPLKIPVHVAAFVKDNKSIQDCLAGRSWKLDWEATWPPPQDCGSLRICCQMVRMALTCSEQTPVRVPNQSVGR
jgi:hypothetical protein